MALDMARALLETSGLDDNHWPLAVQHASYLKNRLPYSVLGDRMPCEMALGYSPDTSRLRIFGSQVQASLSP